MASEIILNLDKPRRIRLGLSEMSAIEAHFDKGIAELFGKRMGVQVILVTMLVCFRRDEQMLTLPKVEALVEEAIEKGTTSLEEIGTKIAEAVQASGLFGKADKPGNAQSAEGAEGK